ncbi:helix-turn-helix transcriptional regulator [Aneurinibacillus aneurinilyticus]|nr:helix-turn-helix transcriptional regulator [Aneurinibacillus aneurinilyticus]MED0705913.1 helix-turn-helix transcriptional regulator [Aneurinibacillus aneurinilyticus]MED0722698.1 helix-turn-helix transcriptional regulator [Aneurinibacillus aneurinilyticus]MED0731382.1 helix-turn-helix transcriptional regulator [Aneurinibacillus aneurinilyticus]MED0740138.1 helix-turn-helix transcriptional regulator [Aneurinibacillus aneurinilyticus]
MALVPGRCLLGYWLKRAKMSQTELARRIGFSPQVINDYVHNRRTMNLAVAATISAILNCTIEELYKWNTVPFSELKSRQNDE